MLFRSNQIPEDKSELLQKPPIQKHKVVLLGNQQVGKTSMIYRLQTNTFQPNYNVRFI